MSSIVRKVLAVVVFVAVLGVGAAGRVVPSEAATTTVPDVRAVARAAHLR